MDEGDHYKRHREHDPSVDGPDPVERDFALSDFGQSLNEDRHFNGEPEFVKNALDPEAVLDALVVEVKDRRRE